MAIKHICDICRSETDVRTCFSAQIDFCGQCHIEYHDRTRDAENEAITRLGQIRSDVVESMIEAAKTKVKAVTPINQGANISSTEESSM